MTPKTKSPEAAQKKVWKAEIRDHQKAAAKVIKDFDAEERRLHSETKKAYRTYRALEVKLSKFRRGREIKQPRSLAAIERRIGILKGRLGI